MFKKKAALSVFLKFTLLFFLGIATMLGLELVPLLLQFVPPFDAFLRGHGWEISHGSNHGRVVVEGEMQRHRAHGSIGVPVTRLVQRFLFDKNLFLGLLKSPKVREN